MKNCHDDMIAYHDEDVTLPHKERTEMRDRRNTNRRRLKAGLKRDGESAPIGCRSQGSYSMRTMVQQPDKDYDIDDGVYFDKEKLKGPQGGDKSAGDAKEMVRKALHDDSFKRVHGKVPADIMKYLDLDETDTLAMDALVAQAQTDVYETLSRCGDASDTNGQLLHALLNELAPMVRAAE